MQRALIESTKAPSGHPARYSPENVHMVSLSYLHSHFKFAQMLHVNVSDVTAPVHGFQFVRPDNRRVNYFTVIKDAKKEPREFPYPTLDEWIQSYLRLVESGEISLQDISILPLVQVRKGRKHFNTLCVYADEQNRLHVLIIEPREDNRMIVRDYPVQDIITKLRSGFANVGVDEVSVDNLMIGTQSRLDDTTCGAQHINALEIFSQLNARTLENHQQIKKYIATAVISRRDADNGIIHSYNSLTTANAEQIGQRALDEELLPAYHRKEKSRPQSIISKEDSDGFVVSSNNDNADETEINMQTAQLMQSRQINLAINTQLQQRKRATDAQRLEQATMAINKYMRVDRKIFGFFAAHTRHETAVEMVNILNEIQRDDNLTVAERNYKAAMFLYYCYTSMSKESGVLQSCIEESLVKLLDCALEFNHISSYAREERCMPLTQLFANRLRLQAMNMPKLDIRFELIRDTMRTINNNDSSIKAKFSQTERHRIDAQRAELFVQIRQELFKEPAPRLVME